MVCFRITRTTITIDEQLLDELKRRATEQGTTVSRLIEDSVRLATRSKKGEKKASFELVTYGKEGQFTRFDLDKMATVVDEEDVVRHSRRD